MSDSTTYDLIVVGLGAMGSAALFHAAKAGHNVLGIDRYDPPHSLGSSHAETRITRLAIGEGPQYLPFVARSHEIWRELEQTSGRDIFYQTGGYIIAPRASSTSERWGDFVNVTASIAAANDISYQTMTAGDLMARQPNLLVSDDFIVGFEPTAGVVLIEEAIAAQLSSARSLGARTLVDTPVTSLEPDADGVTVSTATQNFRAAKVIVTAGAWIGDLVPTVEAHLEVTRQTVVWFEVDDPDAFSTESFSYVMWPGHTIDEYLALWPAPPGSFGLKAMRERFDQPCHPDTVDRTVSDAEIAELYEQYIDGKVDGVRPTALNSAVCLYTNTPDDHFLIDHHPDSSDIIVASPCSGHGFKHSTALAEAMVQLALTGQSTLDLTPFGLSRLT